MSICETFQNHEKIAVIMNSMEFIIDFEKFRNVHCETFQNHEKIAVIMNSMEFIIDFEKVSQCPLRNFFKIMKKDRRNNDEFDGIHY